MSKSPNFLLIVLDTLREDAIGDALEVDGRCYRAAHCVTSAPWTLPSCTSILTGVAAYRHGHFWRQPEIGPDQLLAALPSTYRKVGIVNNGAISSGSGVERGFDKWHFSHDHDTPFRRTRRLIRRLRPERPHFILLHSNIVHDYCLPVASRYLPADAPDGLGERIIDWANTTEIERAAASSTYAICAAAQRARVNEILEIVRERNDFITAVTADHGEGFDYGLQRIHHGGRVHQDLVRVPFYVDLPTGVGEKSRSALAEALATQSLSTADIIPTIFDLGGFDLPGGIDGRPAATVHDRTIVTEDRRYLYLRDRFRVNYRGHNQNMTDVALERNRDLTEPLAEAPRIRSFLRHPHKLVVTDLRWRQDAGDVDGRRDEFADLLLGKPLMAFGNGQLLAFEEFDLSDDPGETTNLLDDSPGWLDRLRLSPWADSVTLPSGEGFEVSLATATAGVRPRDR